MYNNDIIAFCFYSMGPILKPAPFSYRRQGLSGIASRSSYTHEYLSFLLNQLYDRFFVMELFCYLRKNKMLRNTVA